MVDEKKINKAIDGLFEHIEFSKEPRGLYDPLRYMMEIGGKRIRPRLCLTTYMLYKDELDESIIAPAAALEVFHSFTLLHDDIMDRSPMRRGKPTVWTKWNEDTAILSGDVMSIDSYRRLAKAPAEVLPEVLALFSKTAAQVCEGQQYDMDFEGARQVSMGEYMKMIGLKTAVLIAASGEIGAIIGGAPEEDCRRIYQYGYQLGLAFQIADDYLDTFGDEKVFGKPIGGDIVNNKKSWLLTYALEKTSDRERLFKLMELPVETKEQRVAKITFMKAEYNRLEIAEAAKKEVRRLTDLAMESVTGMQGYDSLKSYADKLVGRAK